MVKIVATSDLHGHLPKIPPCDLLLLVGDLCPEKESLDQVRWLNTTFRRWLEEVPAKEIISVAGNHDYAFEKIPHLIPQDLPWRYLQGSITEAYNLKIYGAPWQLPFCGVFNLEESALSTFYENIPPDVDIILSHGAPFGIGDELPDPKDHHLTHTGSKSLLKAALKIRPKLCLFGHIHSGFGIYKVDSVTFANVALLDNDLQDAHDPVIFTL